MSERILLLGNTGMVGSSMEDTLRHADLGVLATASRTATAREFRFDAYTDSLEPMISRFQPTFVINCIGAIPQRNANADVEAYWGINRDLPLTLAELARDMGFVHVHIGTDCVFRGDRGPYSESASPDASDVYGRSKADGERLCEQVIILRCSIVGRSRTRDTYGLLGWLLSQPLGAEVRGFDNHRWNGVTALALSRIVRGIIASRHLDLAGKISHVVPADSLTKFELLQIFAQHFGRQDLKIAPSHEGVGIDRRLTTKDPSRNQRLWRDAGYLDVPSISDLVDELTLDAKAAIEKEVGLATVLNPSHPGTS